MKHLRNLTLASAKHLLSQGQISQQHHDTIVSKIPKKKPRAFGSMLPAQQAQTPIPPIANGNPETPSDDG